MSSCWGMTFGTETHTHTVWKVTTDSISPSTSIHHHQQPVPHHIQFTIHMGPSCITLLPASAPSLPDLTSTSLPLGEGRVPGGTAPGSPEHAYKGDIGRPGLTNFFFSKSLSLLSAGYFSLSFMVSFQLLVWAFLFLKKKKKEEAIRQMLAVTVKEPRGESLERTPGLGAQLPQRPGYPSAPLWPWFLHLRDGQVGPLLCFPTYATSLIKHRPFPRTSSFRRSLLQWGMLWKP